MEDIPRQSPEQQPIEEDLEALRRAIARVGIDTARSMLSTAEELPVEDQPPIYRDRVCSECRRIDLRTVPIENIDRSREFDMGAQIQKECRTEDIGLDIQAGRLAVSSEYGKIIDEIVPKKGQSYIEVVISREDSQVGVKLKVSEKLVGVLRKDDGDLRSKSDTIIELHDAYDELYKLSCGYQEKIQDALFQESPVLELDQDAVNELKNLQTAIRRLRYEAYFRRNRFAKAILNHRRSKEYALIVPSATSS